MKTQVDFQLIYDDLRKLNADKDYQYTVRELEELADVALNAWESNSLDTLEEIEENILLLSEFTTEDAFFANYVDKESVGLAPEETVESLPQGDRRNDILDKIDNTMSEVSDVYEIRFMDNGQVLLAWI